MPDMDIRLPRGGGSARFAILTFGAVAGAVWLISFAAALLLRADHAGHAMSSGLAGVTSLLMLVVVLPVVICAWQGWWRSVVAALVCGVLVVTGLVAFATV